RHIGIEPQTRTYDGDDSGLVKFVVSLNLHRRHLNESQRAMVAARLANLGKGQRADRVDSKILLSQDQAADLLSVSVGSVKHGRKVQESGVSELAEAVETGKVAVSTAAIIATATPEEQRQVIAADDE